MNFSKLIKFMQVFNRERERDASQFSKLNFEQTINSVLEKFNTPSIDRRKSNSYITEKKKEIEKWGIMDMKLSNGIIHVAMHTRNQCPALLLLLLHFSLLYGPWTCPHSWSITNLSHSISSAMTSSNHPDLSNGQNVRGALTGTC